jgi:hypothetical protein
MCRNIVLLYDGILQGRCLLSGWVSSAAVPAWLFMLDNCTWVMGYPESGRMLAKPVASALYSRNAPTLDAHILHSEVTSNPISLTISFPFFISTERKSFE